MTILFCKDPALIHRMQRLQMMTLLPEVDANKFHHLNTLTTNEKIVFSVLLCNVGNTVSRDQLMCALYTDEGPWPQSNGLQVFIARLRSKMQGQITITPIPGIGYRMDLQS